MLPALNQHRDEKCQHALQKHSIPAAQIPQVTASEMPAVLCEL